MPSQAGLQPRYATEFCEPFVTPKRGVALEDCLFYHTIDLPGHGTIHGCWDLRTDLDAYTGHLDYRGKRVLEFGPASGAVSFHLERQGAEVVAFEIAPNVLPDVVPMARRRDMISQLEMRLAHLERIRNSFWIGHEALGSSVKVVHGRIYDVPVAIGPVDVSMFGCILLHLRDPFLALANGARLTRDTIVVTEALREPWVPFLPPRPGANQPAFLPRARRKLARLLLATLRWLTPYGDLQPQMVLLPEPSCPEIDTWWSLSPGVIQGFLAILGFEESYAYTHRHFFNGRAQNLFTVVARRTQSLEFDEADCDSGAT